MLYYLYYYKHSGILVDPKGLNNIIIFCHTQSHAGIKGIVSDTVTKEGISNATISVGRVISPEILDSTLASCYKSECPIGNKKVGYKGFNGDYCTGKLLDFFELYFSETGEDITYRNHDVTTGEFEGEKLTK